jgi:hypothetical protein
LVPFIEPIFLNFEAFILKLRHSFLSANFLSTHFSLLKFIHSLKNALSLIKSAKSVGLLPQIWHNFWLNPETPAVHFEWKWSFWGAAASKMLRPLQLGLSPTILASQFRQHRLLLILHHPPLFIHPLLANDLVANWYHGDVFFQFRCLRLPAATILPVPKFVSWHPGCLQWPQVSWKGKDL